MLVTLMSCDGSGGSNTTPDEDNTARFTVAPNQGPLAGGTAITITCINFNPGVSPTVTIDGNPATGIAVVGQNITCNTPAGTVGAKTVAVNTGTLALTLANGFTYLSAPTITSVSPSEGPEAGGTTITISGSNLLGTTQIWFGSSTIVPPFLSITNNAIQCLSPARGANPIDTALDVWLTTPGGDATDDVSFTYRVGTGGFDITAVSPVNLKVAGGEAVTITGTGFVIGQPVTVNIGGNNASSSLVVSTTSITCTSPSGTPGSKTVTVTTGGGSDASSDAFVYWAVPTFSQINPNEGPTSGNTNVTITGSGFMPIPNPGSNVAVKINGLSLINPAVTSDTQITGITPPSVVIGAQDVLITTPGGDATGDDAFTYQGQPEITSITPIEGPTAGNTAVTITGSNFKSTGATVVTIGGASLTNIIVSDDGTQITGNTPAGTVGPRDVVVSTGGGSDTLSGGFTYWNVPTITGIIPSYGRTGTANPVTIKGTNFTPTAGRAVTVSIGGDASSIVVVNSTTITCNTPSIGTPGFVNVSVTTPGGTATLVNGFEYWGVPEITEVRNLDLNQNNVPGLNEGMLEGFSLIEVIGNNFHPGADVVFNTGTDATSDATADNTQVIVYSINRLTCLTPPSNTIAGDASNDASSDVTIVNKDGQRGTKADCYWYRPFGQRWQVGRGKFTPRDHHASVSYNNLMWVLGGRDGATDKNDVLHSADGINWQYATNHADWTPRYGHAAATFLNQMFIFGGVDATDDLNDIYASSNGIEWEQITPAAEWTGRKGHSVLYYYDRLWLLGGDITTDYSNEVWYSFDGKKWFPYTGIVPWPKRAYHSCLVFGNKLWLMGGIGAGAMKFNDVWSYNAVTDTWTEELAGAPWAVRYDMTVTEFAGFMYLLGGYDGTTYYNDVWKSGIGTVWTQESTTLPMWSGRAGHTTLSYSNKLYVIGGADGTRASLSEVWSSTNGTNWIDANSGWNGRRSLGTTVYKNKMWVLGGRDASADGHEVWSSSNGSDWTLANVAPAWSTRNGHVALGYKDAGNQEHLLVIGGQSGTYTNEVWDSTDDTATTWVQIATTPFAPGRAGHTSLYFGNRLWVFGGYDGSTYLNDVWSSSDSGKTWTAVTVTTPFPARAFHASVVYDNKMWVIGGYDGGYLNDMLSSIDGKDWTALAAPPWSARSGHTAVRYDNRIWVLGGFDGTDALQEAWWYSPLPGPGPTWVNATLTPQGPVWDARQLHGSVVFGSRMWLIGGSPTALGTYFADTWKNE